MDSAALDRALCERLGIEPRRIMWQVGDEAGVHVFSHWDATLVQQWHERHREYCDRLGYQVREAPIYPALSTSEAGCFILWGALRRKGWLASVHSVIDGGYYSYVEHRAEHLKWNCGYYDTPSMALAMAAAAALGVADE